MTEENEVEEIEEAAPEEAQEQETKAVEAEARKMGWVPQEEFRGPKDQWRDANEFVERGKHILPIVRSQLDKAHRRENELIDKIGKLEQTYEAKFKRLEHMSALALEKQREQLESRFGAIKEAAVERGDTDAYKAAEKAEKAALKDLDEKATPPKEETDTRIAVPEVWQKAINAWLPENEWFRADPEMAMVAGAYHDKLRADKPGLTPAENLAEVREYVKKRYPEKFSTEKKSNGGSPVEGGGSRGGSASKSLYSRLPQEAKSICDKQIDAFLEKGETAEKHGHLARERWSKVYFEQPGT